MTIKVYGASFSTCTLRVMTALEEKGLQYTLENVDLFKGEHKSPAYLEKQPFGVIPVLEDGDVRIFESRAIARYIATKYADQGTDLLGKTDKAKALTDQWLEVESQNYNPPCSTIVAQKVFTPMRGGTPDEGIVATQLQKFNAVLDVYEKVLSKTPYLTGDQFTLADLSHLPYTFYLLNKAAIKEPIESRPNVKAWWERISSRPSFKKLATF